MRLNFPCGIFFASCAALFFASCADSRAASGEESYSTLRSVSEARSAGTAWTREMEGGVLEAGLPHPKGISAVVPISTMSAAAGLSMPRAYPFLHDFGSLDTSSISSAVRSVVRGFCSGVMSEEDTDWEKIFSAETIFSLVFFLHDMDGAEVTSYLMGAPYFGSDEMEIPVRFFCDGGFVDCSVFVTTDGDPQINQVRINTKKIPGNR